MNGPCWVGNEDYVRPLSPLSRPPSSQDISSETRRRLPRALRRYKESLGRGEQHRESEPHIHAVEYRFAGVSRELSISAKATMSSNFFEFPWTHAEDRAVHKNVFVRPVSSG